MSTSPSPVVEGFTTSKRPKAAHGYCPNCTHEGQRSVCGQSSRMTDTYFYPPGMAFNRCVVCVEIVLSGYVCPTCSSFMVLPKP